MIRNWLKKRKIKKAVDAFEVDLRAIVGADSYRRYYDEEQGRYIFAVEEEKFWGNRDAIHEADMKNWPHYLEYYGVGVDFERIQLRAEVKKLKSEMEAIQGSPIGLLGKALNLNANADDCPYLNKHLGRCVAIPSSFTCPESCKNYPRGIVKRGALWKD